VRAFFIVGGREEASKHYGATWEYWSFVISVVTDVTRLRVERLIEFHHTFGVQVMTPVTCGMNRGDPTMAYGYDSLITPVCADDASVQVRSASWKNSTFKWSCCADVARAAVRLHKSALT